MAFRAHGELRDYRPDEDEGTLFRLLREIGWSGREADEEAWRLFLAVSRAHVVLVDGETECFAATTPATLRYLDETLPLSAVGAVATSLVARKQGFAARVAARAVAADAAEGALVAALGVFDQGYYDQLGFGAGSYEHQVAFDPAQLRVDVRPRPPRRITRADGAAAHAARLRRWGGHGQVNLLPFESTAGEMTSDRPTLGLGYADAPDGGLTHYFWGELDEAEHGPLRISWLVFRTREQFLELLALIKSLADSIHRVRLQEPPRIQLQDLLDRPFRHRRSTEGARAPIRTTAAASWQMRICDLPGCLARTRLPGRDLRFNLRLSDPIARYLPEESPWRGTAGEYRVALGPSSTAEPGTDPALPTLTASVNAFTRLWLGVRPASGLAVTDDLSGPSDLLHALDEAFRLPDPQPDWDF